MTHARTRASRSAEHAIRRALRCVSACALFVFTTRAAADPCVPHAALAGDADAVARVAAELQRLGVAIDDKLPEDRPGSGPAFTEDRPGSGPAFIAARTGCPQVAAQVELDTGGGIAVAVRDRTHRSEGRVVSDPALAAVWIDSWLRDDFDAPLAVPAVEPPPAVRTEVSSRPARPWFDRVAIGAAIDQAWTGDATRWKGLAGAACARVDRLAGACLGARVRYATQDVVAGMTAAHRTDTSVLATAATTLALGSMHVSPELGVGVGRMTTARVDGCKPMQPAPPPPNCDPNDPMCVMPTPTCDDPTITTAYVGDQFFTATWTPRLSATLHVAVPLFDHVWLEGVALAGVAPFGHRDPYAYQGMVNTMPPGAELSLPGEPLGTFVVGVGLRVGAP